jgi:hypothetical protein
LFFSFDNQTYRSLSNDRIDLIGLRVAFFFKVRKTTMASIGTRSRAMTSVNAAFLQEVKDSNLQLWTALRKIRNLRNEAGANNLKSRIFVSSLGELRDAIALEFSLEETYGYIESVSVPPLPYGCADAGTAKAQHCELYLQLHELCEQSEEAQYRGTISRDLNQYFDAFDAFDAALRAHEELESDLIHYGLGLGRRKL